MDGWVAWAQQQQQQAPSTFQQAYNIALQMMAAQQQRPGRRGDDRMYPQRPFLRPWGPYQRPQPTQQPLYPGQSTVQVPGGYTAIVQEQQPQQQVQGGFYGGAPPPPPPRPLEGSQPAGFFSQVALQQQQATPQGFSQQPAMQQTPQNRSGFAPWKDR